MFFAPGTSPRGPETANTFSSSSFFPSEGASHGFAPRYATSVSGGLRGDRKTVDDGVGMPPALVVYETVLPLAEVSPGVEMFSAA